MYHLQGRRSRCQPWESPSRWLSSWGGEGGERGFMEGAAPARWRCVSELMGRSLARLENSRERRVAYSLGMVCSGLGREGVYRSLTWATGRVASGMDI